MPRSRPTEEDRTEAIHRLLAGLARGDDVFDIQWAVSDLHPRNNTFPGEVFLRLGADAMDVAGVDKAEPIESEELREKFLPEFEFRGKKNRKIQFAILATAATRGGLEPDLLDELVWWQTDDFWSYGMAAAVALIRASAERIGISVPDLATRLAELHGIELQ